MGPPNRRAPPRLAPLTVSHPPIQRVVSAMDRYGMTTMPGISSGNHQLSSSQPLNRVYLTPTPLQIPTSVPGNSRMIARQGSINHANMSMGGGHSVFSPMRNATPVLDIRHSGHPGHSTVLPGISRPLPPAPILPGSVFANRNRRSTPGPEIAGPFNTTATWNRRPDSTETFTEYVDDLRDQEIRGLEEDSTESEENEESDQEDSNVPARKGRRALTVDDEIEDRQLIECVQNCPLLWDHRLEDHRNREKTETAWRSIGQILKRDWRECKLRWQSLRARFARKRKKLPRSGSAYEEARSNVTWTLYHHMEFLTDCVLSYRRTSDNMGHSVLNVRENSDAGDAPEPPRKKKKQRVRASDVGDMINQASSGLNGLITALSAPPAANPAAAAPDQAPPDTFTHFGLYIAGMLRSCTPERRRRFQPDLLRVLAAMAEVEGLDGAEQN